ncbi:MAG: hypothetical protein ACKO5Q_15290, partial [Microcystaceae cyanobacterium]
MTTNTLSPILTTAVADVISVLTTFAADPLFAEKFTLTFGTTLSSDQFLQLVAALPEVEVLADAELRGASGAFSAQTGKIYLTEGLLQGETARLEAVILEEFGHFVDAHINTSDSAGDEGAIFAALVQGDDLGVSTLQALKVEDDHGTIVVNGEVIQVEQQNFTGTNGNDTITGTSGNDVISPLLGYDAVDGGAGNDLLIVDYSSLSTG